MYTDYGWGKTYNFIMYDQDDEDFENKESKSFSCFAIHDEEAFSVLDKNFYLYTGEGETELSHYSFDHEKYVIWQLLQLQNHQLIPLEKKYVLQKFFRICSFGASILKTEKRTSINLKKDK